MITDADVRYRRAVLQDLDDIMWLERTAFPTDAWSSGQMAEELSNPQSYYLVAELTETGAAPAVIGYAGLRSLPADPVADIQTIAVSAQYRGHGIGRALFTGLLTEAGKRGVADVFLEVRADNPVAQSMYRAFGFERIATRPRYYQPDDVDAWVMRRTLASANGVLGAANHPGPIGQEAVHGDE